MIAAHVEDGSFVSKGDPLFELDPRPFEAALASTQALLSQSLRERDLARIEFERTRGLASKANASQLEFDQKRIALEVAEAKILEQEAAVESARLNLEYTKILSPITGRAAARMVDPGNIVKANEATLQMIRRLDPIYVEFTVPENELMGVRRSIATVGQDAADAVNRNLRVEVDLPEDSTRILSALGGAAATTQTSTMRRGSRTGRLTFLDNTVQSEPAPSGSAPPSPIPTTISGRDSSSMSADPDHQKGRGADPGSGRADRPAGSICVCRDRRRYGPAALHRAWPAAGRSAGRRRRRERAVIESL